LEHKFDISNKNKLDNPVRREKLPPYQVLSDFGLKAGDCFVDVGAGIGYFSLPASDIVGKEGLVYALDVELEMLEEIERKLEELEVSNLRSIVSEEYDFKLDNDTSDFTYICMVIHEVNDHKRFLAEAHRITVNGGKLVIVEWNKKQSEFGPPIESRIEMNLLVSILNENGFKNIESSNYNEDFYYITATVDKE